MIVIGHQHISMQPHPKTFRKICQQFLEFPIVTFVRINDPPFNSPDHYVIPRPRGLELEVAAPSPLSCAFSSVNVKAFFLESLDPTLKPLPLCAASLTTLFAFLGRGYLGLPATHGSALTVKFLLSFLTDAMTFSIA